MTTTRKTLTRAFCLLFLAGITGFSAIGCGSIDTPDDATIDTSDGEVAEAESAFTANTTCTTAGGGTWGAILRMCVSISTSGGGTFTVSKADGTAFSTAGTMYLKVGTYQPYGVNHATATISGGNIISSFKFSDVFSQWPGETFPKNYFARWESQNGGYAYVGPITISQ